jgi:hypothetical protein
MNVPTMTEEQAFAAMYFFLRENWRLNSSLEVGGLLGFISLLPDGKPADPAMWQAWKMAVKRVVENGERGWLHFQRD